MSDTMLTQQTVQTLTWFELDILPVYVFSISNAVFICVCDNGVSKYAYSNKACSRRQKSYYA